MSLNSHQFIDAKILIVDEDEDSANQIKSGLVDFQNVNIFLNGEEALKFCRVNTPDLIIIDAQMPSLDGRNACKQLRETSLLTRCPIIFLAACEKEQTEVACWESGASDFLRKPVAPAALNMRVMSHLTTRWHIEIRNRLYHTDSLTGLKNRYFYEKHIKEQAAYANRYQSDMSILIVNLDSFSAYNLEYGAPEGDNCLKEIAHIMRTNVKREPDCICRYSGAEFIVILPGTDIGGAQVVGEKLVSEVAKAAIPFEQSPERRVTISVGVASLNAVGGSVLDLIDYADKQLQCAKENGRSMVA